MAIKKPEDKNIKDDSELYDNGTSTEIPIKDEEDNTPDTVTADFQDEDLANQFAAGQTKPSKDKGGDGIDPNTPGDKLADDIRKYEEGKSGKLEYKDFYKIAEFLITLIDTAVSTGLNWFAKDTASSAYSLPVSNKKLLTEQLALVLAKYQTKFSIEWTFFMGLILLYAPSFLAANSKRKENKKSANRRRDTERAPGEPWYKHDPNKPLPDKKPEEKIPDNVIEGEPNVPMKKKWSKRNSGKQPKAF